MQHQLTDTLSVEAAYVGNRGSHAFIGDGPAANANQPSIVGFAQGVSTNLRRPFFAGNVANAQGFGGAYGWTQSFDYFCNCATNLYNSLQTKATKRFGQRLLAVRAVHAAAFGEQRRRATSSSIPT